MPNPKLSIIPLPQCLVLCVVRNNSRLDPSWSSVLSIVRHPDFFALCRKGSLFPFFGAPNCRNSWPSNSQPVPDGFEDKLSGHSHSGGSGCMIVTFYQVSLKVDTLAKYPTANSFLPQNKCTMKGTSSDFIAHLPA
jgi:hypothetical protein